jgi:hypothetical protein
MCLRAVFKISEHALVDHNSKSTDISTMLAALAVRTQGTRTPPLLLHALR